MSIMCAVDAITPHELATVFLPAQVMVVLMMLMPLPLALAAARLSQTSDLLQ